MPATIFSVPFFGVGYASPSFGARPLKRAIQQQFENPLAKEILAGRFSAGTTIRVDAGRGGITFASK